MIHIERNGVCVYVAILAVVLGLGWPSVARGANTWRELTTPPEDSLEAENTRIWLPVEHKTRCRVTIEISDQGGVKVRTLFDALLGQGYYNFWWDKLDDSGQAVAAGDYRYRVIDQCGNERSGTVTAAYREWELKSRMRLLERDFARGVVLELFDDSARVTARVYGFDDVLKDQICADSLMNRGVHHIEWDPGESIFPGRYKMKVSVGDYLQTFIVRCAR